MKRFGLIALFLSLSLLVGLYVGCQRTTTELSGDSDPLEPAWFVDQTGDVELRFQHDAGPEPGRYFMPQAIGSGAALFDFDGDDRLDIYLLQNGGPNSSATNRLYRQLPDGRFQDVSKGSELDIPGWNMGVAVGDVNNDGRPDVVVTQFGGVKLFLNRGDGKFQDITRESGLHNPAWGASAAFFDFNRDGLLDLVIANYVDYDPTWPCDTVNGQADYCAPKTFKGQAARLFRNRSGKDGVRFEDVTIPAELYGKPGPGLGVLCADFNGDRWPDIFIANDGAPNHLWINQHNGKFIEDATTRGVAYNIMGGTEAGMGATMGDVDGDGLFDLYVTHLTEEMNRLWKQGPRGQFTDCTAGLGLVETRWRGTGFGTILGDFDLDGALDLAVVNGRVSKAPHGANELLGPHWSLYAERNQLFANDGTGKFRDLSRSNPDLCGTANVARGLACGDVDNDGSLDLLVTTTTGPAKLYRNLAARGNHWLRIRAVDAEHGGRDALGAEIRVRAGKGTWLGWVNPASSFLCSNDPRAHFGLGAAANVDDIAIVWPDGVEEHFRCDQVDQPLTLTKGKGERK